MTVINWGNLYYTCTASGKNYWVTQNFRVLFDKKAKSNLKLLKDKIHFFYKQLGSRPSRQSCLYFQDFQGSMLLNDCLVVWPNKQILSIFQWFLTFVILYTIVKDQKTFYEIHSLTICINIKAFNRVNRKQLNILKTFLEYLEFYIVAYWRWFKWVAQPLTRKFQILIHIKDFRKGILF